MANIDDLSGRRFGRLSVISQNGRSRNQEVLWLCKCDCGKEATVTSSLLKTGNTRSCGCLKREESITRFTKHGRSKTRLYRLWSSMIQRCYNPKNVRGYPFYGAKGVIVCDEWKNPDLFIQWAEKNGYKDGLSIDRIDSSGNYCPHNCQWVTIEANREKHRDSIMLRYKNDTHPLKTWCDKLGLPTQTVRRYYHYNGKASTEYGLSAVIELGEKRFFNKNKEELRLTVTMGKEFNKH